MDPSVKNLREWVGLLFALFCALDIAAVQYGVNLIGMSPDHPEPALGRTVALIHGARRAWAYVYVTSLQMNVLHAFLGAAAASLFAMLGVVIADGMRQAIAQRDRGGRNKRRYR